MTSPYCAFLRSKEQGLLAGLPLWHLSTLRSNDFPQDGVRALIISPSPRLRGSVCILSTVFLFSDFRG